MAKKDFSNNINSTIKSFETASNNSVTHLINVATPSTEITTITCEINFYKAQTVQNIIEIGKRLKSAKELLPHGEFQNWLKSEVEFSKSTAYNFIKIAEEYLNFQPVGTLGYTKMIALLQVPTEEREEFIAEKHLVNGEEKSIEDMSKRELERVIKERDSALKSQQELENVNAGLTLKLNLTEQKMDELKALDKPVSPEEMERIKTDAEKQAYDAYEGIIRNKASTNSQRLREIATLTEQNDSLKKQLSERETPPTTIPRQTIESAVQAYISAVDAGLDNFKMVSNFMPLQNLITSANTINQYTMGVVEQLSAIAARAENLQLITAQEQDYDFSDFLEE